jgi:hypothetical protein
LQYFRPLLLHVDLLRVPVAKLAEIYPQLALGVAGQGEHVLAVRAGEAKGASAILESALVHAFAGAALLGGELRDCAIVAAVGGAIDAGVDLFLQDVSVAFALYFHLGLGLLWWVQEVDSCLCEREH